MPFSPVVLTASRVRKCVFFFLMLGVCRPSWSQDCVGEKIKTRSILRKGKDQEIEVCVVKHQSNLREAGNRQASLWS